MNHNSSSTPKSPATPTLQKGTPMNRTTRLLSRIGSVLCGALLGYTAQGQPSVSVDVNVGLPAVEIRTESDFYEPLTSYGEWVVVGSYGRCWRPARVEANWRPYCNGHWQRTEADWYWVSDEPWGWATYHYGRWNLSPEFGWYWVPQTQWAPAWVSWHTGGGYVGWAPLYPSGVTIISPRAYVFVQERRFTEPVRPTTVVVNTTVIINQTVIKQAPAPAYIERASGRKVQALPVQQVRHQTEAAVVAQPRTAAAGGGKRAQPSVRTEAQPVERKAVAAPAPGQVERPANAAPAPKKGKAQSGARKVKPAANQAVADKPRQETPEPATEKPAGSEKNESKSADKDHGNKGKE